MSVALATACPAQLPVGLLADVPHTVILIDKSTRSLGFYLDGVLGSHAGQPSCVPVALGFAPVGPKRERGDGKTPEGVYRITNKNAHSSYYLSLGISYPNAQDAAAALAGGVISSGVYDQILHSKNPPQNTAMGGDIYLHGGGVGSDWTLGCVAMDNAVMDWLFVEASIGTTIVIVPGLP